MNFFELLKSEKIYIIPTRYGVIFLGMTIIVLLSGATYQNNLIYILAFLMFSIFVLAMVQTHANVKGIELEVLGASDGVAGEPLIIQTKIINKDFVPHMSLEIEAQRRAMRSSFKTMCDRIDGGSSRQVNFSVRPRERGLFDLPAVNLCSSFPLGLFSAWKVYRPSGKQMYVYPSPEGQRPLKVDVSRGANEAGNLIHGNSEGDEFREHRLHQEGESFRHVDWKIFARKRVLVNKHFENQIDENYSFEFENLAPLDTESRLKQLAQWIQLAEKRGASFDLVLPTGNLGSGSGPQHLRRCQRALARFERAP